RGRAVHQPGAASGPSGGAHHQFVSTTRERVDRKHLPSSRRGSDCLLLRVGLVRVLGGQAPMEMKTLLRANWDRVIAVALVVLGAVALIVGWFGVSGTGIAAEQNPYIISAGVGGIALI